MPKREFYQCLTLILVTGAMAACSKPEASKSADATASATPAAAAVDLSKANPMGSRPGLWEMATTVDGVAVPMKTTLCVDAALGERMDKMAGQMKADIDCPTRNIRQTATGAAIDQVCTMDGTTMTSQIEVATTADGFHQTVHTRYSPAYMGRTETNMVLDGKWQGACPADMKPGDMRMPGGVVMNMYSLAEQAKKGK